MTQQKTDGKTSQKIAEILETLDGQEIRSLHYENVVLVEGNKIIDGGKVVDIINTLPKAQKLMDEAFYDEFGYYPSSKKFKAELEAEFGKQEEVQ